MVIIGIFKFLPLLGCLLPAVECESYKGRMDLGVCFFIFQVYISCYKPLARPSTLVYFCTYSSWMVRYCLSVGRGFPALLY